MKINEYADIAFINGKVITVNKKDEIKEAVVTSGKKILAVGSNDEVKKYINDKTKIIDLRGRSLCPGFIDSHMHFMMYSLFYKATIDIAYDKAKSIEEIKKLIKEDAAKKKPGEWICLWGYDQNKLLEKRHPTIKDLDEAAPNNPVQCVRCCGHMGVYNSKALEIAGIDDPNKFAKGEVVVDEEGNITGLLKETPNDILWGYIRHTDDELKEGFRAYGQLMLKTGITSIHDAGTYGGQYIKDLQDVIEEGSFPVRVYAIIYNVLGKEASKKWIYDYISTGIHTGMGNEHFKIGAAKILLDGSTSGPSCATREPYSHDPNLKGILNWKQEEINELFLDAQKAGFQLTAHAVGDKAVEQVINALEYVENKYPVKGSRNRIEHCGLTDEKLIERIKNLNIIPISNPGFFTINGSDYNRYYGDRVNYMFAAKTYKEKGIITAFGSDCSVINENPMLGIYGAVTRKDMFHNEECGPCQKISILDAIRCYTYNGAYASFEEDIKGSIEEGKLADLVVLEENILESEPEHIKDIKVDMTVIDGQILYER
ncbi:MAG: amidohydrolase [Clostridiales bacterium]|nr:amidohydrolase [Clostridiales bacterium]